MTSAHATDPWRIVAPLAGDRSLRGLAATKRLRPEQRAALEHRLIVREYRRHAIIYRPGEIFGHSALVEVGTPRVFEAAAYTGLRLGRISARDFLDALAGKHAREVSELVSLLTERWLTLSVRLARFLVQNLRARVAASLIEAARGFGVPDARGHVLALRITQNAIAELSAGSLRKVKAVLRSFEQEGLISKQ